MVITNSPDIGTLEVEVRFDLTGANPVINLTNQTTPNPLPSPVPDLSLLVWVLNIYSPTGTPIYQSDFDNPWKPSGQGDWTTASLTVPTAPWPRPFGQIEWSDYRVEFQVKDTAGTIYELFKSKEICRPAGLTKDYQDTFGHVKIDVEALCDRSSLYLRDSTSKLYQGFTGVNQESYLVVDYPRDSTGTLPAPYELTSFVTDALVPFYQNGEHSVTYYSIWRYDLGDNVFIDIRYVAQVAFEVQCNIDLCPIACEVSALEASISDGSCGNVAEAQRKLNLITPKLLRAFIAKQNPTCGIDLPALIDEIKEIGGFSCDCNTGSSGIGTSGSTIPPFVFSVNNEGGNVVASFSVTDGNVVLNIKDKSYTFTPGSGAIQLATAIGATNNTVSLSINLDDLAEDIYQTTAASTYLLNLFNSLVLSGGSNLSVDGKCIFTNGTCDLTWTLTGITGANAQLVYIEVAGVMVSYPQAFNTGTLAAFQTYLNSLGIGTFTVTDLGAGNVQIVSNANTFDLGDFVYIDSTVPSKKLATLTKDCSVVTDKTPSEIVQAIIDWMCPLGAEKVYTSESYDICYIDPVTLTKKTETIASASTLPTFFAALMARGCNTVDFIMSLKSVSCASIQALFATTANTMGANDFVMGTKLGDCARIYPVELGTRIMQLGAFDQNFITAFCAVVELCNGGKFCQPFTLFTVTPVPNSPADDLMSITVAFEHDEAISVLVRYARIDQGTLNWSEPASVLIGASPYSITNVDEGQYRVGITPVYADGRKCSEVTKDTDVCGAISSFSAIYNGTNIVVTYSATSEKVRIVVQYPNGGTSSQIELAAASPVTITPPADLTGLFSVTIQPVCNENTEWYGPVSAPAVFEITPANNSTTTNNASITLASIIVTTTDENGNDIVFGPQTLNPAEVGDFYVADGTYSEISLVSLSGSAGWTATLVASSGTYPLNGSGVFENVVVGAGSGIQIVIIDTSP